MAKRTVVKKVQNAVLYSDGLIRIDNVRLSYPHLGKPYAGQDGGEPKYSATALLPKASHKEAKDLVIAEITRLETEAKFKVAADKKFIRNGDDSGKPENEGMWTVSAREANAPILRDRNNANVERVDAERVFYGGCWVNLVIRPWMQNNKFGKRVNANLSMVQFVRDDKAFGEGRISEDDADDILAASDDGVTQADEREEEDAL